MIFLFKFKYRQLIFMLHFHFWRLSFASTYLLPILQTSVRSLSMTDCAATKQRLYFMVIWHMWIRTLLCTAFLHVFEPMKQDLFEGKLPKHSQKGKETPWRNLGSTLLAANIEKLLAFFFALRNTQKWRQDVYHRCGISRPPTSSKMIALERIKHDPRAVQE